MPKHSPFTRLCGQLAELARPRRADLHVHTTASDGEYTPTQVVALARQAGLCAVAITDHDTLASVAEARATAGGAIELVPGVEVSTGFAGRELHLLGYFVRADDAELNAALAAVCESRRERFRALVALLREKGMAIPDDRVQIVEGATVSLGRRNVAVLLTACGHARNRVEAFHRFVNPLARQTPPKTLIPLEEAVRLVHAAGGVTSLAHPPADLTDEQFRQFRELGVDALEANYPWGRNSPAARLREVASRFGFAVSGGSDCHGPDPAHRRIGTCGISAGELATLRERARSDSACSVG